jgi:hypothetical protein
MRHALRIRVAEKYGQSTAKAKEALFFGFILSSPAQID